MKILVTGGAGYLGSVLIPKLLARRHQVRVLDVGYFGVGHLRSLRPAVDLIREDIRTVCADMKFCANLVEDLDCIIHLAAISNDPSAELYPDLTAEVNIHATRTLAEMAQSKNIRFIFSSSCSVYGETDSEITESGPLNPLTIYAKSKMESEQLLENLANERWAPLILRNGTLFGYSPRMRFDLVANIFSLYSSLYNEIKVFGEGGEWRPFLHVDDCARAIVFFAEKSRPHYRCYNIAHENLRVIDLANIFKHINPALIVTHISTSNQDSRNYRVSTQRMQKEGFCTRISLEAGAEEMTESIISGLIQDPESIYYRNVKWLNELTRIGEKNHKEIVTLMESVAYLHGLGK